MGAPERAEANQETSKNLEPAELEEISQVWMQWLANPPDNDRRIRAFAEAAVDLAQYQYDNNTHSWLRLATTWMVDFRKERNKPTSPVYGAYLFLRAAQHILRRDNDYSKISSSKNGWTEGLESIFIDLDKRDEFESLIATKEITTNVPDRYKGPQLWLSLYKDRFDKPVSLLDVGASLGAGTKALLQDKITHQVRSFQPTLGHESSSLSVRLEENQSVSRYINSKLSEPISFGSCAAVDVIGIRDASAVEWTKSCFYPSEIVDGKNSTLTKFNELVDTSVPNLSFHQLDFTSEEMVEEFLDTSPVKHFDVITLITMMNQLREDERLCVLKNAKRLADVIILQDFVRTNPEAPNGLEFASNWLPYTYRTLVFDNLSLHERFDELFWWKNGRCKEVLITPSANSIMSGKA